MLIKEYRIPLPLTVDEYRIAQLYMIAKKSRDESSGAGSGVEIIINEPYENGPGGNGQYTKKIYHIGSHLPGWVKGLLPKSALTVEEQAWNAYPYTKTRYTCPFVEKFSLDIETYYFPDDGNQENVFALTGGDLRNRVVDLIDVVKEQPTGADYIRSEDPTLFMSEKTNRGPLNENWLGEYWNEVKGKKQPTAKNMSLMCAYKLCRVEFRYWGMQTKLEKFIHDIALRKTMLRAHRQAWAWQDEWHGLTIDDIREIERQTQLALQRKFGDGDADDDNSEIEVESNKRANQMSSIEKTEETPMFSKKVSQPIVSLEPAEKEEDSSDDEEETISKPIKMDTIISPLPVLAPSNQNKLPDISSQHAKTKFGSKDDALHSPIGSTHSFDLQVANWRMEKLEVDSKSGSEEEFFDCLDMGESTSLAKWSSLELLPEEDDSPPANSKNDDSIFSQSYLQRVASERGSTRRSTFGHATSVDRSYHESPPSSPSVPSCPTSILILVFHAGSVLDTVVDKTAKKSDVTTFRGAFESIMRQHYPSLVGHVIIKLVSCPSVSMDAVGIVSSLSPYSFELSASDTHKAIDLPLGAIPLLACSCTTDIHEYVNKAVVAGNAVYNEFLKSEDGRDFNGQIVLIGDSMGSILAFDAICRSNSNGSSSGGRHGSEGSGLDDDHLLDNDVNKLLLAPSPRRRSSSIAADSRLPKFDFEVSDFFIFGSPLGFVLAARRVIDSKCGTVKPHCSQIYNLFHPTDPNASRLEPLISARFSMLSPVNVPRYGKFPLGNGQPCHLLELIHSNPQIFHDIGGHHRRSSDTSMQSNVSGLIDNIPLTTISNLQQRWWGIKRLDYAFYCPEGLNTFPVQVLPHLFHGSYWESSDVIAFVLRQLARFDSAQSLDNEEKETSSFNPGQPTEKWIKKRTSVKLKNVAANHRANDVIAREGEPQKLTGRFMYGPFDMITLAGEKVDVHIMKEPPVGEWVLVSTEVSDKTGRVSYTIPEDKSLGFGIYPIKMVVRGDHTSLDFYMAVIPQRTECVVFSIDGSFTASMSVTGKDPKVRAGAVDVCRHWQELGYLLIYVTGRPDMQQQRVLSWLSQHNFPHGLISFADGISTDPLGHKTAYLNSLIQNHSITICAAYGSSKDITVYTNIGLKPKQIYIVGKVTKKLQINATVLAEGYTAHLNVLTALGGCRPAHGNQRMVIPRGCFNLPGQTPSIRRRRLHEPEVN